MILENPAFYLHQLSVYLTIIAVYSLMGFYAGYSFAKSGKRISHLSPVAFVLRAFESLALPLRKQGNDIPEEPEEDWETRVIKREVRMVV